MNHAAHFEIVRTDAEQPWHARVQARNGELTWSTETYVDRDSAISAIGALASLISPVGKSTTYMDAESQPAHVDVWLDEDELGDKRSVRIEYVDERAHIGTDHVHVPTETGDDPEQA